MLARRIPSILPNLTFEEALETTKIHSVAGELDKNSDFVITRPFRAPHHTISGVSMVEAKYPNQEKLVLHIMEYFF